VSALAHAGGAAPGPLSALSATIMSFAAHALAKRRLVFAMIAEPLEAELDAVRLSYRQALLQQFETRIRAAMERGYLPAQDAGVSAAALLGGLAEGLIGSLAPPPNADPAHARAHAQALTLFALRGLGVIDARARGLVVQTAWPSPERSA
jgi:hypothetical protein